MNQPAIAYRNSFDSLYLGCPVTLLSFFVPSGGVFQVNYIHTKSHQILFWETQIKTSTTIIPIGLETEEQEGENVASGLTVGK